MAGGKQKRKKKDGQDPGKKRQRMRADVKRRREQAASEKPTNDQADLVTFKQGSAADRNRRGAV